MKLVGALTATNFLYYFRFGELCDSAGYFSDTMHKQIYDKYIKDIHLYYFKFHNNSNSLSVYLNI